MSEEEVVENICLIRRKFEAGTSTEKKIKYLKILSKLPITLSTLKKTSIGKAVNSLRKEDGIVGELSKKLVIKWKDVACSEKCASPSPNKEKLRKDDASLHHVHKYTEYETELKSTSINTDTKSSSSRLHESLNNYNHINGKQMLSSEHNSTLLKNESSNGYEGSSDDGDANRSGVSFGDMLMMPTANVKKRKKKNHTKLLTSKSEKVTMPTLPDIQLPSINVEPIYRPISQPMIKEASVVTKRKKEYAPMLTEIKSRKTRSVMYSGKKHSNGVVTSLFQQCMRVMIENVDLLYETGGVPYKLLKPLLMKCTPAQLERLEYYNPHFVDESDELWKTHCQREFKGFDMDEGDMDGETWKSIYKQLLVDREDRLKNLSTKITAGQAAKLPERSVKLAYVAGAPKPSMQMLRKQKRYGTDSIVEKKKELRERMDKEQRSSAIVVPFTHVPRRDRCSVRPPSSLSSTNRFNSPESKRRKEEFGSHAPESFKPTAVKKPARKPMMTAALKLLKKQKGRMSSSIIR